MLGNVRDLTLFLMHYFIKSLSLNYPSVLVANKTDEG